MEDEQLQCELQGLLLCYSSYVSASGAIVEDEQLQGSSRACCYATAAMYQHVVHLWKMSNCKAVAGTVAML